MNHAFSALEEGSNVGIDRAALDRSQQRARRADALTLALLVSFNGGVPAFKLILVKLYRKTRELETQLNMNEIGV